MNCRMHGETGIKVLAATVCCSPAPDEVKRVRACAEPLLADPPAPLAYAEGAGDQGLPMSSRRPTGRRLPDND